MAVFFILCVMGVGFEAQKVRFGRSDSVGNVEQSETARQGEGHRPE